MVFGSFEQGVNFLLAIDYNKIFLFCKPTLIIFINFCFLINNILIQKIHNNNGDYMYLINCFFVYSMLGHFIESFFYTNNDSGILFGYWTPIYGIGVVLIIIIYNIILKFKIKKIYKVILLFFISSIFLASIESLGGYLIKWMFNKELWNYSNHKFNIGRYTSLEMSLTWGISSILLVCFFKPIVDKFIKKIPKFISYVLITLFVIDLIATISIKMH